MARECAAFAPLYDDVCDDRNDGVRRNDDDRQGGGGQPPSYEALPRPTLIYWHNLFRDFVEKLSTDFPRHKALAKLVVRARAIRSDDYSLLRSMVADAAESSQQLHNGDAACLPCFRTSFANIDLVKLHRTMSVKESSHFGSG